MNRFWDNCKSLQKKGKKGQKRGQKMLILGYFDIFDILGPFLLILNQKKYSKFQKKIGKIWQISKIGPKNADFGLFWTKK